MAEEVGAAFVSLIPSARGFSAAARRAIKDELRGNPISLPVQPEIDQAAVTRMLAQRMRVTIGVDIDRGQVQAALMGATARDRLTVDADVSAAGLIRETRAAIAATEATRPSVQVEVDVDRSSGWLSRLLGRSTVDRDGRALGTQLGAAALTGLGDSTRDGIGGVLSGLAGNPIVSTAGGALGLALGAVVAPVIFATIGAATAAATLAGAGLGAIFAGAFILASDPLIQQSASGFMTIVTDTLTEAAQPLKWPLIEGMNIIAGAIKKIGPDLKRMFEGIAPYIPVLAQGVADFIAAFTPGLVDAVIASGPVLEQIAWVLPDLGAALGDFLSAMAAVAPQAATFIGMLARGLADIIPIIAAIIRAGAMLFGTLAATFSTLWDSLKYGIGLLSIIGAVIFGDFGRAKAMLEKAIGDLIGLLKRLWSGLSGGAAAALGALVRLAAGLPGRLRSAVGSLGNLLYRAGQNVVQGLISGIWSRIGALADAASNLAGTVRAYLPFSPAKEGPLSGSGNPYASGQQIGTMLAGGMESRLPAVASAGASLAGAVGLGARGSSAGTAASGRLTAEWIGGDGDPIVRAIREHVRIYYGGSPDVAFGG